ncbi:hypothetical protein [Enterococcus sp. DIV0800]|uniref:hypothetical protein n=1 Tax=unclassified Enterococcus TaxID=2608891 RepID=UPI003D2FF18C
MENGNTFKRLFDDLGIYQNGKSLLVVFSAIFKSEISIEDVFNGLDSEWAIIFTEEKPQTSAEAEKFMHHWQAYLASQADPGETKRVIIWESEMISCLMLEQTAGQISTKQTFSARILGDEQNNIEIKILKGARFRLLESGQLSLEKVQLLRFNEVTELPPPSQVFFHLLGEQAGTLEVAMTLKDRQMNQLFRCGLSYEFKDGTNDYWLSNSLYREPKLAIRGRFKFGFNVFSDNRYFFDELVGDKGNQFLSNFITLYGKDVYLEPQIKESGLVLSSKIISEVTTVLFGKFKVFDEDGKPAKLLCGFSGTEYLATDGLIEFVPNQAAFAPTYPATEFSIEQFIDPANTELLTNQSATAWIRFSGSYHAQPAEAPFFTNQEKSVLEVADLASKFPVSPAFPLFPFKNARLKNKNGVVNQGKLLSDFDQQVLSNERAKILLHAPEKYKEQLFDQANAAQQTIATPTGFVASLQSGVFQKVAVAFPTNGELAFEKQYLGDQVFQQIAAVFQSPTLFCVLANTFATGATTWQQGVSLDGWTFDLTPGKGSRYNDYGNVVLIKNTTGKIYDPDNSEMSLCANPDQWISKEVLAQPTKGLGEIANLAQWVLNYCQTGYEKYQQENDEKYQHFAQIITDPDWKGILVLNAALNQAGTGRMSLPDCIQPLLAGVEDSAGFKAHHLGAELVALKNAETGPVNEKSSAFFGLIDYQDPAYLGQVLPIKDSKESYEFRLLQLQIQFENNLTKSFSSLSQFVLGAFMGLKPIAGGNLYNAFLMNGTLQTSNGCSSLRLQSTGGELNFAGVLAKAEITEIAMTTLESESYAFDFNGKLNFSKPEEKLIDLFSFSELLFEKYRVHLKKKDYQVALESLNYDLEHSSARTNSLVQTFNLVPLKVHMGREIAKGYHPIAVEKIDISEKASLCAGIECSVLLGGLGGLASDSVLTAKILLAWNPQGVGYIGIHLPGQTMIQRVIELSLGEVRLIRREGNKALTLLISQVALRLLGVLKLPANGSFGLALSGDQNGIGWFGAYQAKEKGAANVLLQTSENTE